MFNCQRKGDTHGFTERVALWTEGACILTKIKLPAAHAHKPAHGERADNERKQSSQSGTRHSKVCAGNHNPTNFARREDKEVVEHHIEQAHEDIEQTGNMHVAATTEHSAAQGIELGKGNAQAENEEIERSIAADILSPTQPMRQALADGYAYGAEHNGKRDAGDEALAQHMSGFGQISSSYAMGYLYVETHTGRGAKAAEEP